MMSFLIRKVLLLKEKHYQHLRSYLFRARIASQTPTYLGRLFTKLAGTWARSPGAHWPRFTMTPINSLIGMSLMASHFSEQALTGRVFLRSGARVYLVE